MPSRRPTWRFVQPAATRVSTSRCRFVSSPSRWRWSGCRNGVLVSRRCAASSWARNSSADRISGRTASRQPDLLVAEVPGAAVGPDEVVPAPVGSERHSRRESGTVDAVHRGVGLGSPDPAQRYDVTHPCRRLERVGCDPGHHRILGGRPEGGPACSADISGPPCMMMRTWSATGARTSSVPGHSGEPTTASPRPASKPITSANPRAAQEPIPRHGRSRAKRRQRDRELGFRGAQLKFRLVCYHAQGLL